MDNDVVARLTTMANAQQATTMTMMASARQATKTKRSYEISGRSREKF